MSPWAVAALVGIAGLLSAYYFRRRALVAERRLSEWTTYGAEVIDIRRRLERTLREVSK